MTTLTNRAAGLARETSRSLLVRTILATLLLEAPAGARALPGPGSHEPDTPHDAAPLETSSLHPVPGLNAADRETLLNLLNHTRSQARVCGNRRYPATTPLIWDTLLEAAARNHAEFMAQQNTVSHLGQRGSTPGTRVTAIGYAWSFLAENVAAGYDTGPAVTNAWLSSPAHCANIMNSRAVRIGVGRASNPASAYRVFWVLDLAAPQLEPHE